jgi:hypothetical protein
MIPIMGRIGKTGIDKLVIVHTLYPDEKIKKSVEETVAKIELSLAIKGDRIWLGSQIFSDLVKEIKNELERFGSSDEIYLHLEGGERHIILAMCYASFFVRRNIRVLVTTKKYNKGVEERELSIIPAIPSYELTPVQHKALQLVAERDGQTLTEISSRINKKKPKAIAPAVLRNLRKLVELNLVSLSQKDKKVYSITASGRLFL